MIGNKHKQYFRSFKKLSENSKQLIGVDKIKVKYFLSQHYSFLFLIFFISGIVGGYFYLKINSYTRIEASLYILTDQIKDGLKFKDGKWDTTRYNADPNTPHPRGSSGFSTPLYILTTDGFVLERTNPIKGFLDSSNFKYPLDFKKPETIETITNEQWRVVSKPIISKKETIGVIMVTYYAPDSQIIDVIDEKLLRDLEYIASNVEIKNDQIITKKIEIKNLHYEVSFEVVNNFNKVIFSNGRMPIFIDASYISEELRHKDRFREIRDLDTDESFWVLSTPVLGKNDKTIGVIVVGGSINEINNILADYGKIATALSLIFGFLFVFTYIFPTKNVSNTTRKKIIFPRRILFDKKRSFIAIDEKLIHIPYATNQFYLCDAIFTNPNKRWEQDELLKKFGNEDATNGWRIIYDAALAINKKTSLKLIERKDKTFMLNPYFIKIITKT